jgi:EmrB/QacA subfamily drug resistance transporter
MVAVGGSILMATLDISIVNISLPTLIIKLNTDFPTIQWVILSYVLVVTSLMMGAARLGDMFGMKKLYLAGLMVFTVSSLLCGLAPNVGWLIAFRALQGVGAVMLQALGTAIITAVFPGAERGRAMGIIGGIVSVGLALGPALGGVLIGVSGWRSVFLVNVPIGVLAILIGWRFIPLDTGAGGGKKFDVFGGLALMITLICYALAMTMGQRFGFNQPWIIGLLAAALAGLICFVIIEFKTEQPMIEPGLFKNTLFSLNLVMGLVVFTLLGGTFILPFYLVLVKGYATEKVGLLMMTVPLAMGLISPVSGVLSDRLGPRGISLLGLVVIVIACLGISTLDEHVTVWGYILRLVPFGLGMGIFQSPNNSAIMGAVPRERLGVASGLLALSRTLGHTSGLPLMGAVFAAHVTSTHGGEIMAGIEQTPPDALVAGVAGTFHFAALVGCVSVILAVAAVIKSRRKDVRT